MTQQQEKPARIMVYIPEQLLNKLKEEASVQHRSMNGQVLWCIEKCLEVKTEEHKGK